MRNDLSHEEVIKRLKSYPRCDEAVTTELSRFGEILVREIEERAGCLDAKATNIAGYAGIILAFLVSRPADWGSELGVHGSWFVLAAIISAGLASAAAFWAMRSTTWGWYSDKDWFKEGTLDDSEKLRRFYISRMHAVKLLNGDITARKATAVVRAQFLLALAAVLMAGPAVSETIQRLFFK